MSIPPLVCSTPPPPDQCEDDKDPEDFDVQYNLSQDDDENYDYGDFSTYNHLQYSKNNNDVPVVTTAVENEIEGLKNAPEQREDVEYDLGTNSTSECNPKVDEETNVEDLDLKLDETLASTDITDSKDTDTTVKNDPDLNVQTIPDSQNPDFSNASSNINICPLQSEQFVSNQPSLEQEEELPSYVDEVIAAVEESLHVTVEQTEKCSTAAENDGRKELDATTIEDIPEKIIPKADEDDDFGDFDDFQFTSTTTSVVKPVSLVSCDNPWGNIESADNDDFGDFKANFEDSENNMNVETEIKIVQSTEVSNSESTKDTIETVQNDDDFGDFNDYNDFQTSSTDLQWTSEEEELFGPFWGNLDMTDEVIVEKANKVFDALFMEEEDENTEPETEYSEKKLESVLGEIWGHILEVETRQPYMVNWNNSLSQKTILKSLCIDSRNILFGPKWTYNMPKYAANLSVAPLQPLKQMTPAASTTEGVTAEKAVTKPTSTWSDPFTSDGQESCNTESRNVNPAIEIGPTDLDVFEASTSKSDKIFSSTISVQPLRQINLPDTHIFTPTDSETPRSTTIHYDNSPTVILPQPVIEKGKSEPQVLSPQPSTSTAVTKEDDDYWEFQDFKGTSSSVPPNRIEPIVANPNGPLRTQMLQPIKIEPIMPKLNWPDPGEVKETFDDFTDFISSTSVNIQPSTQITSVDVRPTNDSVTAGPSKSVLTPEKNATGETYDDEFNTFQSALPSTSMNLNFPSTSGISNIAANKQISTASHIVTDFDSAFPKNDNIKSDTISFENTTKAKDNFVQNQMPSFSHNLEASKIDFAVKTSTIQTTSLPVMGANLLQPTPATSNAIMKNQQKSDQILQPLSLESYSQINWPNPGMDFQDLSRFNPVETLQSLKSDLNVNSPSKVASPVHSQKSSVTNQVADSDDWGEFVSSKPKQPAAPPKKQTAFVDDDEWTDFVSSPGVKPQNGLNTISLNVHTNNIHKSNSSKFPVKSNQLPLDIPSLNYITPKSSNQKTYNDRHFQNL